MGYSIREGVADAERRLTFYRELVQVYPDAFQEGDRWCSRSLNREDCEGFKLEPDTSIAGTTTLVYVRFYRNIGEGRVYTTWENRVMLDLFLDNLWRNDPGFHTEFLSRLKAYRT